MAITRKPSKHENCSVQVEWLDYTQNLHYAKLMCIDTQCTHKKKWIQWLSLDDAIYMVEELGVSQSAHPQIDSVSAVAEAWL